MTQFKPQCPIVEKHCLKVSIQCISKVLCDILSFVGLLQML